MIPAEPPEPQNPTLRFLLNAIHRVFGHVQDNLGAVEEFRQIHVLSNKRRVRAAPNHPQTAAVLRIALVDRVLPARLRRVLIPRLFLLSGAVSADGCSEGSRESATLLSTGSESAAIQGSINPDIEAIVDRVS